MPNRNELKDIYSQIKPDIDARRKQLLESFDSRKAFMKELVFCLCTPQTNAHKAWGAAEEIVNKKLYTYIPDMTTCLGDYGVRFKNNKANYIAVATDKFNTIYKTVHEFFAENEGYDFVIRNWLIEEIKGYGFKEASHFLRNIGHSYNLCILDRHILRCLVDFGVISEIPKNLNSVVYQDIECKMIIFSDKTGIDLTDLDFVFWYRQNGEIFK